MVNLKCVCVLLTIDTMSTTQLSQTDCIHSNSKTALNCAAHNLQSSPRERANAKHKKKNKKIATKITWLTSTCYKFKGCHVCMVLLARYS